MLKQVPNVFVFQEVKAYLLLQTEVSAGVSVECCDFSVQC